MRFRLWLVQDWFAKRREKAVCWFVWRLPKWVVYWCGVRLFAHATTGPWGHEEAPAVKLVDAMDRFAPNGVV